MSNSVEENRKLVIAALVVLLGSNAGSFINAVNPNVRSDPMTGTEGDALDDRIGVLELEVENCKDRNSKHRESQSGLLAKLKADVENNRFLIERCMVITGQ